MLQSKRNNNQQFQSSAYEEEDDNYFISKESSSSDSISESLMSDSDNSKQEYEIASPKTNKSPLNSNVLNSNHNSSEQIPAAAENGLSVTHIPSIGNNLIANGESTYATFGVPKSQSNNII